jgi:hypothetical protein
MKAGPPLLILQVEVVLIHTHQLAREAGATVPPLRPGLLPALEAAGFLLRDANKDHALDGVETSSILGTDVVLALLAFERHQRDSVVFSKGLHGLNEAIVQRVG